MKSVRSDQEIVNRINDPAVAGRDFFGFERNDLIVGIQSFEYAKAFLKEGTTEEEWEKIRQPNDRETLLKTMLDYMPFAWEKANNCRGISASRSISHFQAWTWLAGEELEDMSGYQYYGKDELSKICEIYGWDPAQWDDGERTNG